MTLQEYIAMNKYLSVLGRLPENAQRHIGELASACKISLDGDNAVLENDEIKIVINEKYVKISSKDEQTSLRQRLEDAEVTTMPDKITTKVTTLSADGIYRQSTVTQTNDAFTIVVSKGGEV